MKREKTYLFCTILILVILLSVLLEYYHSIEKQLFLESNKLYTTNSVHAKNLSSIKKLVSPKCDFQVFGEFSDTPNVRAYYSNNYKRYLLNLYGGEFFKQEDTDEAIVGRDVKLAGSGEDKYYLFKEKKYNVIGYFGITSKSFMDDQVLLNDSKYFSDSGLTTILDTEDSDLFASISKDAAIKDKSALFDNFFTERILFVGTALQIIVCIILGIIICFTYRREVRIKLVIGIKKSTTIFSIWLKLSFCYIIIFLLIIIITYLLLPQINSFNIIKQNIINYCSLVLSFFLCEGIGKFGSGRENE